MRGCGNYPAPKKVKCRKTCGLCEPSPLLPPSPLPLPPPPPPPPSPSACADKEGEKCKKKLCDKYPLKKKRKCKKTCDECGPQPPPPPSPIADCADLADKGCKMPPGLVKKCKKKPKYMKKCNKKCKQDAKKKLCEKTCCELGF